MDRDGLTWAHLGSLWSVLCYASAAGCLEMLKAALEKKRTCRPDRAPVRWRMRVLSVLEWFRCTPTTAMPAITMEATTCAESVTMRSTGNVPRSMVIHPLWPNHSLKMPRSSSLLSVSVVLPTFT